MSHYQASPNQQPGYYPSVQQQSHDAPQQSQHYGQFPQQYTQSPQLQHYTQPPQPQFYTQPPHQDYQQRQTHSEYPQNYYDEPPRFGQLPGHGSPLGQCEQPLHDYAQFPPLLDGHSGYLGPPNQFTHHGAPPSIEAALSVTGPQANYLSQPHPTPAVNYQQVQIDIRAIYSACRGFGTDEKVLYRILANRDGPTIDAIRQLFKDGDLIKTLEKETSGNLETTLVATALGPVESEAFWANRAIAGAGTNETLLTESVLGHSNQNLAFLKQAYQHRYCRSLESDVKGDLSMKTQTLFTLGLQGRRPDEWIQADPNQARYDTMCIYQATKAKLGTDQRTVCEIFTRCNENQLRAIGFEYERSHGNISQMIKSKFSGHMQEALLYLVDGAINKPMRDAMMLEECMKGFGTKVCSQYADDTCCTG